MRVETRKILDRNIEVHATCVRVPVFVDHGEAINIEFAKPLNENDARDALRIAPGVMVMDQRENDGYITPVECAGDDAVYVSQGPDPKAWSFHVGGVGQPAQGGRAQLRADRRGTDPQTAGESGLVRDPGQSAGFARGRHRIWAAQSIARHIWL